MHLVTTVAAVSLKDGSFMLSTCDAYWFGWCQSHLAATRKKWEEEIELEKARGENLFDRLNDLSDIHQDELIAIKQVCSNQLLAM